MDISVNLKSYNLVFSGKLTKFSKEYMDRTLLPMLKEDTVEFSSMIEKSGYTPSALLKWFKESLGVSAADYFKARKQDALKNEMKQFCAEGASMNAVAKHYGKSRNWVYNQYVKFGLKIQRTIFDKSLDLKIPELLNAGHSIEVIAEKMGCSATKIRNWMNAHIGQGIVRYRHDNNIILKHKNNNLELTKVDIMKKCFEAGKTLNETAKILDMSKTNVIRLKNKYGLKTDLDIAHEKMVELVPKMMEDKLSIEQMSLATGLSRGTIGRWIVKNYGKNYIDIRMGR